MALVKVPFAFKMSFNLLAFMGAVAEWRKALNCNERGMGNLETHLSVFDVAEAI